MDITIGLLIILIILNTMIIVLKIQSNYFQVLMYKSYKVQVESYQPINKHEVAEMVLGYIYTNQIQKKDES